MSPDAIVSRTATRLLTPRLSNPEDSRGNLIADIVDMTAMPGGRLSLHDIDTLDDILRAVEATSRDPDGNVRLTERRWSRFVGIRRDYLTARRAQTQRLQALSVFRSATVPADLNPE